MTIHNNFSKDKRILLYLSFNCMDSFMEEISLVLIIALLNAGSLSSRYLVLQLKNTSPLEDRIEKYEFGQRDFNSHGTIISLEFNK